MSRLSAAVAALLVGASTLLFPPSAAASIEDCPVRSLCGWTGSNFTGQVTTFNPGVLCANTFPVASVANTYPSIGVQAVLSVYSGPDCTGVRLAVVRPGQSQPFLGQPGFSVSTPS